MVDRAIPLLEQTGPAHLVGHYWGSSTAWLTAATYPHLVRTLTDCGLSVLPDPAGPFVLARHPRAHALREALRCRRRVHLRYVVPTRDEATERDVDPMRVLNIDGHWYLEGWCHRAQDVRMFRIDRVESVEVLDAAATVPTDAATTDLSRGFFAPNDSDPSARIRLAHEAAWVADYYPCHDVERSGEYLDVTLYVGDGRWLRRLLLQLGGAARVLRPASLTDDVADEARRALEAYGVDPSQTARAL